MSERAPWEIWQSGSRPEPHEARSVVEWMLRQRADLGIIDGEMTERTLLHLADELHRFGWAPLSATLAEQAWCRECGALSGYRHRFRCGSNRHPYPGLSEEDAERSAVIDARDERPPAT